MNMPASTKSIDLQTEGMEFLADVFGNSAPGSSTDLLQNIARGLGNVLQAETTFIAYALDNPPQRMRGVAAWNQGQFGDTWEYDLEGNPCQLVYEEGATLIPCDVANTFRNKQNSDYQSFIGVPLRDHSDKPVGHLAVYSSHEIPKSSFQFELTRLCAYRLELEILYLHTHAGLTTMQLRADSLEETFNVKRAQASSGLESIIDMSTTLANQGANARQTAQDIHRTAQFARNALL